MKLDNSLLKCILLYKYGIWAMTKINKELLDPFPFKSCNLDGNFSDTYLQENDILFHRKHKM